MYFTPPQGQVPTDQPDTGQPGGPRPQGFLMNPDLQRRIQMLRLAQMAQQSGQPGQTPAMVEAWKRMQQGGQPGQAGQTTTPPPAQASAFQQLIQRMMQGQREDPRAP